MMLELMGVLLAATTLKLSSSIDDSIWLTKLVKNETQGHRLFIEGTYILSLSLITVLAFLISTLGGNASQVVLGDEKYFTLFSSALLILFSLFVVRQNKEFGEPKFKNQNLRDKINTAFIVSFLGSIDELFIFITIFSLGEFSFFPLLIGTIIAGMIIIFVVQGITSIKFLTNAINKVPIWIIIFVLGCISFIHGVYYIVA